ncbi:hypothetical protein ACIQU6_32825 [Streptomyces sp. NPDC090442]|uniref:MmyB family transcriptional regulator n=1 Tax=Streptomyces sp. NPDC090442 TaxID=3365962 RepID=UPI0038170ADA
MDLLLGDDPVTRRSPGTYGRLERGLLDNPSADYLRGVARILRFSPQEWGSLFSFARGEEPPFPLYAEAAIAVSGLGILSDETSIAIEYLADFAGNILDYNANFVGLFTDQRVPVNIHYYMLFDEHARNDLLPDWEQTWGPTTVTALRSALARHPHNPPLRKLSKLAREDARTRTLLATIRTGAAGDGTDERELCHPELGKGWVQVSEPLRTSGAEVSRHTWTFRTQEQPPKPTLLPLGVRDLDPSGFFTIAERRASRCAPVISLPLNGTAKPGPPEPTGQR